MTDLPTPFETAIVRAAAEHGLPYDEAALMVRLGTTPADATERMRIMRELIARHEAGQ
jgi:hypothetical protein